MLWRFFGEAINHDNAEAIVAMMRGVMTETRGQLGEYTSSEPEKGLFLVRAISQALLQVGMYLHMSSPEFRVACRCT
jgi:hypothetical protein